MLHFTIELGYPKFREGEDKQKFGAYRAEKKVFEWAQNGKPKNEKTLEAQILEFADDVAYSVHDVFDFYQANLIPLDDIIDSPARIIELVLEQMGKKPRLRDRAYWETMESRTEECEKWLETLAGSGRAPLDNERKKELNGISSGIINECVTSVRVDSPLGRPQLVVPMETGRMLDFLQILVRHFLIDHPRLLTIQNGQRRVIRDLFRVYYRAAKEAMESKKPGMVPCRFHHLLKHATPARIAADILCCLTDKGAYQMHNRISGTKPASLIDFAME